jgi:hypothetical protein
MGQMEMKCIFNIGKSISIWANATQVSDMAHGPLVIFTVKITEYEDWRSIKLQYFTVENVYIEDIQYAF